MGRNMGLPAHKDAVWDIIIHDRVINAEYVVWDILLNDIVIDSRSFAEAFTATQVRDSLVNDGYAKEITVRRFFH